MTFLWVSSAWEVVSASGELGLYGNGPLERRVAGLAPQIINRQTALSRCGENVGPAPKDELNTSFNNYCFMLNSMNHTT